MPWDEDNPDQGSPSEALEALERWFSDDTGDTEPPPKGVIDTEGVSDDAPPPRPKALVHHNVTSYVELRALCVRLVEAGDRRDAEEFDRLYQKLVTAVKGKR